MLRRVELENRNGVAGSLVSEQLVAQEIQFGLAQVVVCSVLERVIELKRNLNSGLVDGLVKFLGARLFWQDVGLCSEDVLDGCVDVLAFAVASVRQQDHGNSIRKPPPDKRSKARVVALVPDVITVFRHIPSKTIGRGAVSHLAGGKCLVQVGSINEFVR